MKVLPLPGSAPWLHFMDELIGSGAKVFTGNVRKGEKKGSWSNVPCKVVVLGGFGVLSGTSSSHPKWSYFEIMSGDESAAQQACGHFRFCSSAAELNNIEAKNCKPKENLVYFRAADEMLHVGSLRNCTLV